MARITNHSTYSLRVVVTKEDSGGKVVPVFNRAMAPEGRGKNYLTTEDGLTDEIAREWCKGKGRMYLKPKDGKPYCSVTYDKNEPAPGVEMVQMQGADGKMYDVPAAVAQTMTPNPHAVDEDEETDPESESALAGMSWNAAVKLVKETEDLDQLQEWAESEERESVSKALQERIEELVA